MNTICNEVFTRVKEQNGQNTGQPNAKRAKCSADGIEYLDYYDEEDTNIKRKIANKTDDDNPQKSAKDEVLNEDIIDTMSVNQIGDFLRSESSKMAEADLHPNTEGLQCGDLECPLCLRIYWDPNLTPCGHTFCSNCLERALDHDPKCPLCKKSLEIYLESRQTGQINFKDLNLIKIIKRWFPEEYLERQESVSLLEFSLITVQIQKS